MRKETSIRDNLKTFLDSQGRLTGFPAKRKRKIFALFYLAEKFQPDTVYTEQQVNELLLCWHTFADPATQRRELYDYGFLDRSADGREYRLAPEQPSAEILLNT